MHRAARRGRRGRHCAVGVLALLFVLPVSPRATPIVFRIFNLGETRAYVVQRNASTLDTGATSSLGVFSGRVEAVPGDRIVLEPDESLSPPVPPSLTSAVVLNPTCARLTWTPSGDPTVVGYVVSYAGLSVERGQIKEYQSYIATGLINSYDVCALVGSIYYFSVQAINHVGQLSAYSPERGVEMVTTAVLISRFDAHAAGRSIRLSWEVEADEAITGYLVYRRGPGATERSLLEVPLPADAHAYVDTDVRAGATYTYTLAALGEDGSAFLSAPATATTPAFALALEPNAPNPFRTTTRIAFTLDTTANVTLRVYDVTGALVAVLFDGVLAQGPHEASWAGLDGAGRRVASGTYFYALTAGKHVQSRKMLLVR